MAQIDVNGLSSIQCLRATHQGISHFPIIKAPFNLIIDHLSKGLIIFVKVKLIHILDCAFVLVILSLIRKIREFIIEVANVLHVTSVHIIEVSSLDSVGSSCSWNMMVGTMSFAAARNVAVMVRRSLHYRLSEVMLAVRRLNDRHACSRSGILATSGIIALIVASLRINPDQLLNISSANWTKFAAVAAILTDVTVPAWNKYVICNLVILKANNALFLAFRSDFRAFTL